jgi:hypothetical protein
MQGVKPGAFDVLVSGANHVRGQFDSADPPPEFHPAGNSRFDEKGGVEVSSFDRRTCFV